MGAVVLRGVRRSFWFRFLIVLVWWNLRSLVPESCSQELAKALRRLAALDLRLFTLVGSSGHAFFIVALSNATGQDFFSSH
jgi:hypothetical protein